MRGRLLRRTANSRFCHIAKPLPLARLKQVENRGTVLAQPPASLAIPGMRLNLAADSCRPHCSLTCPSPRVILRGAMPPQQDNAIFVRAQNRTADGAALKSACAACIFLFRPSGSQQEAFLAAEIAVQIKRYRSTKRSTAQGLPAVTSVRKAMSVRGDPILHE